jgi:hypothetical protein
MTRWISIFVAVAASAAALGQASFSIFRPAEGSKVREKVRILIPKGSIPPGGYIGVSLNDKFIEATVPPLEGRFHVYTLDTKGRSIPDGNITISLKLYVEAGEVARIQDETKVTVNVANQANITVPADGLRLRYSFQPGAQTRYSLTQRVATASMLASQASTQNRVAEQEVQSQSLRWMFSVDNSYGNGDGLLRIQPLPDRGSDTFSFTRLGETTANEIASDQISPIYLRLTNRGREVFGTLPEFIPTEGITGGGARTNWYFVYPLPLLPEKPVTPGSSWFTWFQVGSIDEDDLRGLNTLTARIPARGELVGVEWEMGFPCAKIKHSISEQNISFNQGQLRATPSGQATTGEKISLEETVWFSLNTKKVVRLERTLTVDQRAGAMGQGNPFGGGGSSAPPMTGPPGRGRGGQDDDRFDLQLPPGAGGPPGGMTGPPGGMRGPQRMGASSGQPPFGGGFGRNQGGRGFGGANQETIVRIKISQSLRLER